jgi:hypothetical protein
MTLQHLLVFIIDEAADTFMRGNGLTRHSCTGALRAWFTSDQRRRYIDQTRHMWRVN